MVTSANNDVTVIGAGISGLTTAICLAETGLTVRVLAKDPPANTTSAVAGADWSPYLTDDPRVQQWGETSRLVFEELRNTRPEAGIRLVKGMEANRTPGPVPDWAPVLPDFAVCAQKDLPEGYVEGWWFRVPVIDMPRYLTYLENRLAGHGVAIEHVAVSSLDDPVLDGAKVVVNCTGLEARDLVGDPDLYPILGQLVVVANPGIDWFFQDSGTDKQLIYFLPHGDHMILGGCAIPNPENEEVDLDLAQGIIERCAAVEPRLRNPVVLGHRVGLRPARPLVRLETDLTHTRPVVHNYGHGGAGVTASWGCAAEVLAHVQALLHASGGPDS
jgi:D-amino-acid oxidase